MTTLEHYLTCDLALLSFDELCDLYNELGPLKRQHPDRGEDISERGKQIVYAQWKLDHPNANQE